METENKNKSTEINHDRKTNWFQKFIFIFLIPLLFTILLSGIVLSFLHVPVVGKVKSIIYTFHTNKQTTATQTTQSTLEKKTVADAKTISQLQSDKKQLQANLDDANQQLATLKQQVTQLQQQLTDANQVSQKYQDQAKIYAAMKPDQAALIIQQLPENVALQVLAHLTQPAEAAILEKMDPKIAANYLAKLSR